jgi:hypothetical protein
MTDKEKAIIIIDLIEKVTQEIIDKPMQRKRLLQMRSHLEKAVKLTGNGIKREWSRPPSLPLVTHVKAEPVPFKTSTTDNNLDVLADNIPVVTKKARRK